MISHPIEYRASKAYEEPSYWRDVGDLAEAYRCGPYGSAWTGAAVRYLQSRLAYLFGSLFRAGKPGLLAVKFETALLPEEPWSKAAISVIR